MTTASIQILDELLSPTKSYSLGLAEQSKPPRSPTCVPRHPHADEIAREVIAHDFADWNLDDVVVADVEAGGCDHEHKDSFVNTRTKEWFHPVTLCSGG